jgi:hypothetical protein
MSKEAPTIGCPRKVAESVIEDTERLSMWATRLIRERSGKEYDHSWHNYHGEASLLCEYYVSAMSLCQILKGIMETSEMIELEDGTEYFKLEGVDLSIITTLMTTLKICEEELRLAYNISLQLH